MKKIAKIINSSSFKRALNRAANITLESGAEAGFAVYTNSHSHRLSDVIRQNNRWNAFYSASEIERPYFTLDIGRLINDSNGKTRKDIDLLVHSHPLHHYDKKEDYLIPSLEDLDMHEELELFNPGLVDGILVAEESLTTASLFLYRRNTKGYNLYTRFEFDYGYIPRRKFLDTMTESGFASTVIDFDIKKGRTLGQQATRSAIADLFPEA